MVMLYYHTQRNIGEKLLSYIDDIQPTDGVSGLNVNSQLSNIFILNDIYIGEKLFYFKVISLVSLDPQLWSTQSWVAFRPNLTVFQSNVRI